MRKNLFNLMALLLLTSGSINAQNPNQLYERHWKNNTEKIKIMSYNILDGFGWGKDMDRMKRLTEWVKSEDPEVIGLQELCTFDEEKLAEMAAQWGHPYSAIVKCDAYPVGITSKKPIEVKGKLTEKVGHGMIHVKTYGYNIIVTHLNPMSTRGRKEEAEKIAKYIRQQKLDSCVVMGDMNSHSPMDADYLETNAYLLTENYGGRESMNLLDGHIDYSPISQYLALPLIDVCAKYIEPERRFTFPTHILMNRSHQPRIRKASSERLDYIFVSPSVMKQVVDAQIYNEESTYYLSDHYPIAIDLLIEQKK